MVREDMKFCRFFPVKCRNRWPRGTTVEVALLPQQLFLRQLNPHFFEVLQ